MIYYKVLRLDHCTAQQGFDYTPFLPSNGPGPWLPQLTGRPELCSDTLYHFCEIKDLIVWLGAEIYICEPRGVVTNGEDKSGAQQIRLVAKTPWDRKRAELFALDCAWKVLEIYEAQYPTDHRVRDLLEACQRFDRREISREELAKNAADAADAADAARCRRNAGNHAMAIGSAGVIFARRTTCAFGNCNGTEGRAMKEQILALLRAARQRITPRNQWTQGYWAFTWAGTKCDPQDPNAICWCAGGALNKEAPDPALILPAVAALEAALPDYGETGLFSYNDSSTHEQVLAWFDRAIAQQETTP